MTQEDIPEFVSAVSAIRATEAEQASAVFHIADVIRGTLANGGKLLICGNGGSAADSQHMAAELVSSFMMGLARPAFPAIALTTDTSTLTAYANDFGFEGVFARQVEALGVPGDCLLGISTSGSSPNVLAAVVAARARGMAVVALTGTRPNPLEQAADVSVCVPSRDTQAVQTAHLVVEHTICRVVEDQWGAPSRDLSGEE